MKIFNLILLGIFFCIFSFGQGEIDEQEKIFYRNERTIGILLNSNGIGGNFRFAKRIDGFKKTLYEVELNYLKHPKEVKGRIEATNKNIIYGKLHSVYTLKGAIGIQKELFQKKDLGSISIRYFTNFGPSVAFLKPVYYEYLDNTKNENYYDKFKHGDFRGRAPFTKGFNELAVIPGAYGKFGFSFEYSKIDEVFHALELGVGLGAYISPLEIMYTPPQKILFVLPDDQFVLSLFISYRFGKVIDTQFNPRRNKIDEFLID